MTDTEHVMYLLDGFMSDKTAFQVELQAGDAYKDAPKHGVKTSEHSGKITLKPAKQQPKPELNISFAQALSRKDK